MDEYIEYRRLHFPDELVAPPRCRFAWLSVVRNHEVRCLEPLEGHGHIHHNGPTWVQVGYEAEYADQPRWIPKDAPNA